MPPTPTVSRCPFSSSERPPPEPRRIAITLGRSPPTTSTSRPRSAHQSATNIAASTSPRAPAMKARVDRIDRDEPRRKIDQLGVSHGRHRLRRVAARRDPPAASGYHGSWTICSPLTAAATSPSSVRPATATASPRRQARTSPRTPAGLSIVTSGGREGARLVVLVRRVDVAQRRQVGIDVAEAAGGQQAGLVQKPRAHAVDEHAEPALPVRQRSSTSGSSAVR